ncbi:acetyltransferase [Elysia marginata]|uniref:Acetyltransferase n=1 Tax=Elysia marginata TaxID=1093978 RepID=A0AAV4FCM6_9GAST|nr:acetyltransferase [Elysia marginata]
MVIRQANNKDFDAIWPIFYEVVAAGDTYAYPTDTSRDEHSDGAHLSRPARRYQRQRRSLYSGRELAVSHGDGWYISHRTEPCVIHGSGQSRSGKSRD